MYAFHISVSPRKARFMPSSPLRKPLLASLAPGIALRTAAYCELPSFNKKLSTPPRPGNEQFGGVITDRDTLPISLSIRKAPQRRCCRHGLIDLLSSKNI